MKTVSKYFVLPLVCLLLSQPAFAASETLPFSETGSFQPSQPLEQSLSKQSADASDFLSGNFFDDGLSVPMQPIPELKMNTASYAVSRADRASFKTLLASKGIHYITDADLDSLEGNTPASDLNPQGYLLSIAGKHAAIAFMGSKLTPGGFEAAAKTMVFKNKVKQYELEYPFVSVFDGFQMAFTKDDRLVTSYNGQIAVDSVTLDKFKQITERKTDLYSTSSGTPVFQNTRTLLFDGAGQITHEIVDYYFAPGGSADRQLQAFYYEDGSITGYLTETYKDKKVIWRSFETREDVDCGQPSPCSNATSYYREDYSYYANGRLKDLTAIELDPDTNELLYEARFEFENTPKNLLTYVKETEGDYTSETYFTYYSKGILKQAFTVETFLDEDGNFIQWETLENFDKSGVITDETLRDYENGVLRHEEETLFSHGVPTVTTIKTYDENGNLIDTEIINY